MLAKEPVIDVEQILVRASQADHSPEVHAELARLVAEELRLRDEARREYGCVDTPMDPVDKEANLGRSPPCDVCGRICHFAFAQASASHTRASRSGRRSCTT